MVKIGDDTNRLEDFLSYYDDLCISEEPLKIERNNEESSNLLPPKEQIDKLINGTKEEGLEVEEIVIEKDYLEEYKLYKNLFSNTIVEEKTVSNNQVYIQYKESMVLSSNIVLKENNVMTNITDWNKVKTILYTAEDGSIEHAKKLNNIISCNGLNGSLYYNINNVEDIVKYDVDDIALILRMEQLRAAEFFISKLKNPLNKVIIISDTYVDWHCIEYVLSNLPKKVDYIHVVLSVEKYQENLWSVLEQSIPPSNLRDISKFDMQISLPNTHINESVFVNEIVNNFRSHTPNIMRIGDGPILPDRLNLLDSIENKFSVVFTFGNRETLYKQILLSNLLLDDFNKYKKRK